MNVNCPNAGKLACNGEDCGLLFKCRRGVIQGVNIPTAELIAELERRRQRHCDCFNYSADDGAKKCEACIWDKTPLKDNFTPKSEAK